MMEHQRGQPIDHVTIAQQVLRCRRKWERWDKALRRVCQRTYGKNLGLLAFDSYSSFVHYYARTSGLDGLEALRRIAEGQEQMMIFLPIPEGVQPGQVRVRGKPPNLEITETFLHEIEVRNVRVFRLKWPFCKHQDQFTSIPASIKASEIARLACQKMGEGTELEDALEQSCRSLHPNSGREVLQIVTSNLTSAAKCMGIDFETAVRQLAEGTEELRREVTGSDGGG